ncbi:MAG: outer membrane beta-barrel protein [bacterium]|nr:outer membrane beta-barrel protein [bacterium]
MKRTVFTFLILLIAGSALAQTRNHPQIRTGKWDFRVQTRYIASKETSDDHGASLSMEDDLGWGFGLGYNFNEKFNLGFMFSWRSLGYNAQAISQDDPNDLFNYNGTMDTSSMVISGFYTPMEGTITPYINGGIGWIGIDSNIYAGSNGYCWWDPWWGYICGVYDQTYGTNAATYELGVGLDVKLNHNLFVRIGYDHGWVNLDAYDGADMFRFDIGGVF